MQIANFEFLDVGNGWFFSIDCDWSTSSGELPIGFIGNSRSDKPNAYYGPAAWKRGNGPLSSETLLEVGYRPNELSVQAYPFPGPITVTEAGRIAGLGELDGMVFADLDTLLRHPSFVKANGSLAVGNEEERLQTIKDHHKRIGRPDISTMDFSWVTDGIQDRAN